MKNVDLEFLLNIFLAKRKWILGTALIVMVATFGINQFLIKPVYASRVSFFCGRVMQDQENVQSSTSSDEYVSSLNIGFQLVRDYPMLIKVEDIEDQVLQQAEEYTKTDDFYYDANIYAIKQTRILVIEVRTHDPELSKLMANAFAKAFAEKAQSFTQMQILQIMGDATLPEDPLEKQTLKKSAIGFLAGGILAYAFFFLLVFFDFTVKGPKDAESLLKLPVTGTIPQIPELDDPAFSAPAIFSAAEGPETMAVPEYFRAARVHLLSSLVADKDQAPVCIITSSVPAEGKSFISANLAASFAEFGKKVLLINCDLRKPGLQNVFKMQPAAGLVNVLTGEKSFDEAVQKNVMNLPLDVLFCGPVPQNPAKLLGSDSFGKMIQEQRSKYDYIFLTTPPVLATADTILLGKCADTVLLTVRAGYKCAKEIRQAIGELKQAKLNLAGIILNRWETDSSKYSGSYGRETQKN